MFFGGLRIDRIFITMGANGSENSEMLLLLTAAGKLVMDFSPNVPHQTAFWIFKILIFLFFFFDNLQFTIVPYGETKNFNYLER